MKDMEKISRLAELMAKKAVGQLTAGEQAELEAWTSTSERRRQYADMVSNPAFLDEERRRLREVDADRALRAMQARVRPRLSRRWLATAAALTLLLAGGLLVWWLQYSKVVAPELSQEMQMAMKLSQEAGRSDAVIESQSLTKRVQGQGAGPSVATWVDDEVAEQLEEAQRVTTHKDKEYWLQLEDGTWVHLNYNTRLVYPEHFTGASRDVILEGEAYFMVARDRRHPFIVHTPQGDVRQYGTEFNVNTREVNGAVSVVLVKGSIGVTPNGGQELRMLLRLPLPTPVEGHRRAGQVVRHRRDVHQARGARHHRRGRLRPLRTARQHPQRPEQVDGRLCHAKRQERGDIQIRHGP